MTAKKLSIIDFLISNGVIMVLIILVIMTDTLQSTLFSAGSANNITLNVVPCFIIAYGVSGCLIAKGTSLSVGRMVGPSICIAGTLLQKPDYNGKFWKNLLDSGTWWALVVFLICVAICDTFGYINGLVASFLQVPAFTDTLGMRLIIYGVCLVYTDTTPIGGCRAAYTEVAKDKLPRMIPYLFIIALVVGIMMWFIYNKTFHGKYMHVIDDNGQTAEVSGVNIKRTKIVTYITIAALYALGGFLIGAKFGGSSVNMGRNQELEAIAACTIDDVSVNGDIGRVSGVLIGMLVFEVLKTCLQHLSVDINYRYVTQGIATMVTIVLDIRKYIARK